MSFLALSFSNRADVNVDLDLYECHGHFPMGFPSNEVLVGVHKTKKEGQVTGGPHKVEGVSRTEPIR